MLKSPGVLRAAGAKAAKKAEGAQAPVSARGRTSKPRRFYSVSADSDDDTSDGSNRRRKHHNPWCALVRSSPAAGGLRSAPGLFTERMGWRKSHNCLAVCWGHLLRYPACSCYWTLPGSAKGQEYSDSWDSLTIVELQELIIRTPS